MIFLLRIHADENMVASAIAIKADCVTGTTEEVEAWVAALSKGEIREITLDRLEASGIIVEEWGNPSLEFKVCARYRVRQLWPKGV